MITLYNLEVFGSVVNIEGSKNTAIIIGLFCVGKYICSCVSGGGINSILRTPPGPVVAGETERVVGKMESL